MKRRAVLAGIAATLASRPLVAQAQPRDGMRRLSVLMGNRRNDSVVPTFVAALTQGLSTHGWHEGGNLRIDWRWAGGDPELYERHGAELVALGPDMILAHTSPSVAVVRRETKTIPIVFVRVFDPIGQGFVESLARPGGNVTGFSDFDPPMAGKWLGMLLQITPPVAHAAVLYNPATAPYAGMVLRAIEETARSFAVAVRAAPCSDEAEIEAMMTALAREEHGGVVVLPEIFTSVHRDAIVACAAQHRLPAVYPDRRSISMGELMSYGIDAADAFRRSAVYIDRILKGATPRELPVQNPTKFELVINLKTTRTLDITIAPSLLATANKVIE